MGGTAVVSGSTTSRACNPLAPWAVITRTALPAESGSRRTVSSDRRSQCRNPCSDGGWFSAWRNAADSSSSTGSAASGPSLASSRALPPSRPSASLSSACGDT